MDPVEAIDRQHASAVFRFAWGLCGDRNRAEDIVSETFVRLLTTATRIESRTALGYRLPVARNAYLSGKQRRRREVALTDETSAPEQDPLEHLDLKDRLEAALHALCKLPEGERAALLLRVDHALSYEEIALALGTSVGAARVRVHRARLRLAGALKSKRSKPCSTK